jgi:Do/DeqQ family serine protease
MSVRRTLAGVALACALAGAIGGVLLARRIDPGTRAAAPPAAAAAPGAPVAIGPDFSVIAKMATPAVVNISALQVYRTQRSPFFADPFFREFFGRELPGLRMPQEERRTSLGSGVIVSDDGLVVTNNHVIQNAREIAVTLSDRRRMRGTLVGTDPVTDIALVRIPGGHLPALRWGDSARAAVGEYVVAIGNPFRLNQTVTMGIISAIGRSNVGIVDYEDFIQTDAAINPGNSGGALVNVRGELIGINTAIYSETGGYQGIGFAVPANLARNVVEQLAERGRVVRGWVGITRITDVTPENAAEMGAPSAEGVVILEMLRGSPADRAGLQPGDIVVAFDGRPIREATQFRNDLAAAKVGSDITLTVLRNGRRVEATVDVEEARAVG